MNEEEKRLSTAQREQVDRIADIFEQELQAELSPRIEDRIRDHSDLMPVLLLELIAIEREYQVGDNLRDYQNRFPSHQDVINRQFEETKEVRSLRAEAGNETEFPKWIEEYKILQPIGKGGMGQVFMAEQQHPVKRRVAIKVIKSESPTKEILARFEAERQALAMMDHQNIAKVLDCGTTSDGRPYFAMELVKGIPITSYCDQNKLSTRDRLVLFSQACRAIQHSHQKGVAHRDIKPSNILVTHYDGKPVVKVIDFGLAKAVFEQTKLTDRTLFTRFGQVVGTLEYMSPEQAEFNALDVDSRTDIYSLGVLLYELLTGCTPLGKDRLKSEALDRILFLIREEEAPRPSTRLSKSDDGGVGVSMQRQTNPSRLTSILRGELDWIAIKALEKDRTRRYATAEALAEDITRFLNDDPIEARPPSLPYRLQKTARKYKATFTTVVAMLLLLIVGLVATTLLWIRARNSEALYADANTQTLLEMRRAEQARKAAEEAEESATALAGELENTLANHNAARIASSITVGNFHEARQAFETYFGSKSSVDRPVSTRFMQRILFPGKRTWFHGANLDELAEDYAEIDEVKAYANLLETYTGFSQDEFRWWSPKHRTLIIPNVKGIDIVRGGENETMTGLRKIKYMDWWTPPREVATPESYKELLMPPGSSLSDLVTEAIVRDDEKIARRSIDEPTGSTGDLPRKPRFISYSPDADTIVAGWPSVDTASYNRMDISCFDLTTGKVLWSIENKRTDCLEHLGKFVAICSDEEYNVDRLELFDSETGKLIRTTSEYSKPNKIGMGTTRKVALINESKLIGLLSTGQIWEWSFLEGSKRKLIEQTIATDNETPDLGHAFLFHFILSPSPSGKRVACAHEGLISIYDLIDKKRLATFFPGYTPTQLLTWSRDEERILTVDTRCVREWTLGDLDNESTFVIEPSYNQRSWFDWKAKDAIRIHQSRINGGIGTKQDLASHLDGSEHTLILNDEAKICISATDAYHQLRVRHSNTLQPIGKLDYDAAPVLGVALVFREKSKPSIVTLDAKNRLRSVSFDGDEFWSKTMDKNEEYSFFEYLPTEEIVVIYGSSKTIIGIDVRSGNQVWSRKFNGRSRLTGDKKHLLLYDDFRDVNNYDRLVMRRRIELLSLKDGSQKSLLDPLALLLKSGDQSDPRMWASFDQSAGLFIDGAAVSEDGRFCAVSYNRGICVLWETKNAEHRYIFSDVSANSSSVAFSPDGDTVIFNSRNFLCFYDTETGESSGRVKYLGPRVNNVITDVKKDYGLTEERHVRSLGEESVAIQLKLAKTIDSLSVSAPSFERDSKSDVLRLKPPRLEIQFTGLGKSEIYGRQLRLLPVRSN